MRANSPPMQPSERTQQRGLADADIALQQHVAAREHGHRDPPHDVRLADDDGAGEPLEFERARVPVGEQILGRAHLPNVSPVSTLAIAVISFAGVRERSLCRPLVRGVKTGSPTTKALQSGTIIRTVTETRMYKDLDAYWMPFTANRQFKKAPRLLAKAEGMHFWSHDGRQILDGVAGLWCVNAGHARPKIVKAIAEQAAELDFAPPFQMAHPKAFELAEKVVQIGAEGAEQGVLHQLGLRVGRHRAEDGAGLPPRARRRPPHAADRPRARLSRRQLRRHLGRRHGRQPQDVRRACSAASTTSATRTTSRAMPSRVGQPEHGAELADDLERLCALHDPSTIAAVIVEPVAGSTGVLLPPKGYLQRLREICDKHGILLIFDEVITGFGRTGQPFAAQTFGVTPDLMMHRQGPDQRLRADGRRAGRDRRSTTPS